jgi:hypothetical protein
MAKIIFSKDSNGRFRTNNEFFDSVITEKDFMDRVYRAAVNNADYNPLSTNNLTAFTLSPKSNKMLYAVDKNEIVMAFAVQQPNGQIKIMFNDGTIAGKRVYIEDGDVVFTTAEEAKDFVMGQNAPKHNTQTQKSSSSPVNDIIFSLLSELLDKFGVKIEVPDNDDFFDERPDFAENTASDNSTDNTERLTKLIGQRDKFRKAANDILDAAAKLSKEMDDEAEAIDKQIKEEYGLLDFE